MRCCFNSVLLSFYHFIYLSKFRMLDIIYSCLVCNYLIKSSIAESGTDKS